jgi:hypothetical protein
VADLADTMRELEEALRARGNLVEQPRDLFGKVTTTTAQAPKARQAKPATATQPRWWSAPDPKRCVMLARCKPNEAAPAGAIYIGRKMPGFECSALANRYRLQEHGELALDFFVQDLAELVWRGERRTVAELARITSTTTLACWCASRPAVHLWACRPTRLCHGDVLATMQGLLDELGALGIDELASARSRERGRPGPLNSAWMLAAHVVGVKSAAAYKCQACKGAGCPRCGATGWHTSVTARRGRHPSIVPMAREGHPSGFPGTGV